MKETPVQTEMSNAGTSDMETSNMKEITISGTRSRYIAKKLLENGAVLLRADNGKYVFADNEDFNAAFALLEVEFRKGCFDRR